MAPELCSESRYDNKVDVWATGVITFALLTGTAPFPGQNKQQIYNSVLNKQPNYQKLANASTEAKDFIKLCLQKDASQRPSFDELLQDPWFNANQSQSSLSANNRLDITANIAAFRKTTTFQSGVCSIIANLQTKAEELVEVREMFIKLDKDNDGYVSQEELEKGLQDICDIFHLEAPDVRAMFTGADVDKDGKVDYTEFVAAAYRKDVLLSSTNLSGAFKMLDKDEDGHISKQELINTFGSGHVAEKNSEIWDEIMNEVDKDQDGMISFEEFTNAMQGVVEHRATFAKGARRLSTNSR